ncbi:hypothetical protein M378DRAFT_154716, partial [Amanita muscaria Koide BX008]
MVTSDDGGVRLVLTSGGVMTFDGATVECRPVTGKTHKKGRADVVIYDALKRPGWNPHPLFNGRRFFVVVDDDFLHLSDCLALGL